MSVIVELTIPSGEFELGRVLSVPDGGHVELDTVVPLTAEPLPFLWLYGADGEAFANRLERAEIVSSVRHLGDFNEMTLLGVQWERSPNGLFETFRDGNVQLLSGAGDATHWEFELRFPDRDSLSAFRSHCDSEGIPIDVQRVYEQASPDESFRSQFGLTEPQREALLLAVDSGYYNIPRTRTTVELAEQLGISDQAVTERLRRAITSLVQTTLAEPSEELPE
jgi:predicted DNA binding protein